MTRHSHLDEPIYDRPAPAISIVAEAIDVTTEDARIALRALAIGGYIVAPREPTNAMLDAYMHALRDYPKTTRSCILNIGKARLRWAAMAGAGMGMALSKRRICDSDRSGEAGEMRSSSTEGESAGRSDSEGIAQ